MIYIVSNQHWHTCVVLYFLPRYNCGYFCFMFRITFFLIYFFGDKAIFIFFTERGSKIVNNLSDILWLFFYLDTWPLLFGYFWNSALAGLVVFFVHRKSCNNLAKVHTSGLPKLPTSEYTRIQHQLYFAWSVWFYLQLDTDVSWCLEPWYVFFSTCGNICSSLGTLST